MNFTPHELQKECYQRLNKAGALNPHAGEPDPSALNLAAYAKLTERFELTTIESQILIALTLPGQHEQTISQLALALAATPEEIYETASATNALVRHGMIEVRIAEHYAAYTLALDAHVLYMLRGGDGVHPLIAHALAWGAPVETETPAPAQACILKGPDRARLQRTAQMIAARQGRRLLYWQVGKTTARATADENPAYTLSAAIQLVTREALWHNATLYIEENALGNLPPTHQEYLHERLSELPALIWGTEKGAAQLRKRRPDAIEIEVAGPDYEERVQFWRESVNGAADHAELAARGGTEEELQRALLSAYQRAQLRGEGKPTKHDIYAALQAQRNDALAELAEKIPAFYKREQLIVPESIQEKLEDIGARYRQRGGVYRDWGFGQHTATGKGVNALFVGPPGTGKTMAANILAAELGLELYRVDLSRIVNKYIGETEKNLSKIFQAAKNSDALLFFDEADALFGKRTDVKDSHDRYANQETSHLLQLVEDFEGIAILASNFESNMDEAFRRRLHQTIRFDWLNTPERLKLWKSLIPAAAPVGDDIDFEYLAEQIRDFPPAFVKNVVISAAFYARRDRTSIDMRQIFRGIKREFEKEGKFFYPEHFYEYYELASTI